MNTARRVIVVTDCKDVAFQEMKLIILRECANAGYEANVEVDLVAVEEFSIINAAFLTRLIIEQCVPGTVVSLVANPLRQRSERIFGRFNNGVLFFGANTGALTWALNDIGFSELFEINDPGFKSFGGKYVHAPNVAGLVCGIAFDEMGVPFAKEKLASPEIQEGTVVHIDNFGLIKIMGQSLDASEGDSFRIFKNGEYMLDAVFANRMMNLDDNTWVLYKGSSLHSLPELGSVRNKSAYRDVGVSIGDIITWQKA